MAKATKTTKPVVKKTVTAPAAEAPAPAPRKVNRPSVLIKKTAAELRDLIGADTAIGVSRKELSKLIVNAHASKVLGDAGL